MKGEWDYALKLFQWLMPSRFLLIALITLCAIGITLLDWTLSFKWYILLAIIGITFLLALPEGEVNKRFRKAIWALPILVFTSIFSHILRLFGSGKKVKARKTMIDIHCHLLYGVDDGAKTIEESVAMLEAAKEQGISAMILTPHYRHGMFAYPKEKIEEHFRILEPYAQKLGIYLALGTEYHVNSHIVEAFDSGRCRTMAGSRYVLCEYSHDSEYAYIYQMTQELVLHGYIPVFAHVERYGALADLQLAEELRNLGAWITVNADAVLGLEGMGPKKYCKKMLKAECVDAIASDSHGIKNRANHMGKCYELIEKKFGREYADQLLVNHPAKILTGEMK